MNTFKAVRTEEIGKSHAVFFYKEFKEDWGYMGMRDCATDEPTGLYEVAVVPFSKYTGRADSSDAGLVEGSFQTREIDAEMTNRIWWNIKNGISYQILLKGLKDLDLIAKEA